MILAISRMFKNFETRIGFEKGVEVSFVPCCKVLNVWKIIWGNFEDLEIFTIEMILIRIF